MRLPLAVGGVVLAGYIIIWKTFLVSLRDVSDRQKQKKMAPPLRISVRDNTRDSLLAVGTKPVEPVVDVKHGTQHNGRFPHFGTAEHTQKCSWAHKNSNPRKANCTLMVRPRPRETQGVSQWMTDIVTFHLYALQAECHLLFDYGMGVDVHQVLTPNSSWNWTVPNDFECVPPDCHVLQCHESLQLALNRSLAQVPLYRYAYSSEKYGGIKLHENEFELLKRALQQGFDVRTGLACSLSTLFSLNTVGTEKFVPTIYSEILPKLNEPDAFVMALYIRTHHADIMSNHKEQANKRGEEQRQEEREGTISKEPIYHDRATNIIKCALQLEEQRNASRSVWMVVTDSPELKQWISETYNSTGREIVTTPSRGTHSRPSQMPSVADIAEALIDWYLIGESDVVISDKESPTFGGTAALRTARPLYDAGECVKLTLVHNATNKADLKVKKHPQRQY